MKIVASNSITVSNINDGTITHTAYSWSADGTDGFSNVYPNLNLLEGTKDFSGYWDREWWGWENDGTYKGLTVKKRAWQWGGINKKFTAPKDGTYTFSAYVKSSGDSAKVNRFTEKNGTDYWGEWAHKEFGNNFDWLRDSFTVTLKAKDTISARYEISGSAPDTILWTAGHKWEEGSTATPYMPSATEITTNDYPSYRGEYSDFSDTASTDPSKYSWGLIRGNTSYTHTAYSWSADGKDGFTTVYPNLNLLLDSQNQVKSGAWYTPNGSWTKEWGTYLGSKIYRTPYVWSNARYSYKDLLDRGIINTTDNFTYSVYFRVVGEDPAGMSYANIQFFSVATTKNGNIPVQLTSLKEGEWARIVIPFKFMGTPYDQNQVYQHSMRVEISEAPKVKGAYYEFAAPKLELGSIATPYMPSSSEVKTSDWPSYIGQYTDFAQADSTNPSDYTWSLIRGNDGKDGLDGHDGRPGKDGNGIKTTVITYTLSSSGTVTPTNGWTSQVPTLVKEHYLWTKTVWTYTDNTSETGYSVSYIAKDGNNGHDGFPGKDGTGIKNTTITYAGSTSGTMPPNNGWTSTVPTVAAGSYLWTKTVWAYTDKTSETGYSVAKMGNTGATGPQGPQGNTGPQGPAGSNGDPGKIVSDTEPSTRFKGLTWKYSGTSDLTASDGTVINPNTEYYYNGTHWMINYLSANNLEANSIKADKIDAKNLTITDGEFVSTTTNGPVTTSTEIKDNHIAISKTDGTVNTKNDLAVDTEQGFAMKFTNNTTGLTREASVNFQGV
ncbi:collagen-like triple helix repeat-containing protein, partial [Lactococcus lactis]|uniref:collagen-like triple helix repeat-containing protein n=1 Tax=Lactococcus lactis TaxID=1358 RepID=UPI0021A48627